MIGNGQVRFLGEENRATYVSLPDSKYRRSNLLNYSLTSILLSIFNVLLLIIGLRIFIKGKKG